MGKSLEICVPDIGDFDEVEVVELLVAKGDRVEFDDPLVSVESDKATMEIPSTAAGVVVEMRVAEGDKVSEGSVLVILEAAEDAEEDAEADATEAAAQDADAETTEVVASADTADVSDEEPAALEATADETPANVAPSSTADATETSAKAPHEGRQADMSTASVSPAREMSAAARHPIPDREGLPHASPLVRRYARELGVPVEMADGSGAHGRVLLDDVKREVRERFAQDSGEGVGQASRASGAAGFSIPAMPNIDAAAFGPVHDQPLTRIQKVAGPALHRSWLNVPHVTQHDESDITELERFRRDRRALATERGVKLSPLLFVMKAVTIVLNEFPTFRSSLAPEGDRLIVKDYFHLGIAVDTDQGLVVPVIRDVDRKGIFELAQELSETADRARARKLTPDDLKGACFTISSLGGIGGSAFSPIVNAPEVAILGLSKTRVQPVWNGPSPLDEMPVDAGQGAERSEEQGRFEPRLVLPFSLSYDHRVIDGADAVRFTSRLARILSDPLQLLL